MNNCAPITAVFESRLNGVAGAGMRSYKPHWGRVSKTLVTLLSHTEGLCLAVELETFNLSAVKFCSNKSYDDFVTTYGFIPIQYITDGQWKSRQMLLLTR